MSSFARLGREFERLEDRSLPSAFGIPWADPGRLTLSFAPDGTATQAGPSRLFQSQAATGPAAAWQREVLRGFQSWAAVANVNVGLVADGGQAFGSRGAVQGDGRFGDVRVSAAAIPDDDELGAASPFSWTGTTFSGDVVLNSAAPFALGNTPGKYDLFSVAVHEAGHALGLEHSDAAGSVLREDYGFHTALGAGDVAAVRALYGARTPDAFDAAAAGGNDAAARASAVPQVPGSGQLLAEADITTAADVDYYKFTAPALFSALGGVVVRLKASGLSLLTPSLTVYSSSGAVVGSAVSTDPTSNDLLVKFWPGLLGGNYTVKVDGATNDVFGVGAYKLAVDSLSLNGLLAPLTNLVASVLDGHTNDTLSSALTLAPQTATDQRFDATYRGVIEDATDTDTYRVRTEKFAPGTPVTLNAIVWSGDATPLDPRVRVFDAAGNPVAFQVLSNDTGLFSLQLPNAVAGQNYYVQVAARAPGGAGGTGNYFLGVDFNQSAATAYDAVGGGAVAGQSVAAAGLVVNETGLYQFALSAAAVGAADPGNGVTMAVLDAAGNVVFSLTALAGQPTTTTARYLAAGSYTVRYSTTRPAGGSAVEFGLFVLDLSDPVGTYKTTTSSGGTTSPPPPPPPPPYTYTGSSTQSYGYTY